ncbi:GNAT family N-acetyltransferase [Robiginitalea sp. IMCC44478]|uniref:GNAT family N-acetyltransferase n=1 Tax=Robiginitalea sp. IMCC44478 TaxID=3459122 RepID=UPI0040432EC7
MDLQPTLENEFLKLRPLQANDKAVLFKAASDPLIWEQHPNKRNQAAEFERFFAESLASCGALAIIDQLNQQIIGSSRFKRIVDFPNGIEIGWSFLKRDYWGGTYNRLFKELMISHAFQQVDYVFFHIAPENIRSQKAVEKLGGKPITPGLQKQFPERKDRITYFLKKL